MESQKIAIIGSGISGLAAAYLLQSQHEVTLFEKNAQPGGHARTLTVDYQGREIAVDTGFIVFNFRNYPHLTGLFRMLDVPYHKSNMSFAASIEQGAFEYSSKSLKGMFPNVRAALQLKRYGMLRDYFRFSKKARAWMERAAPEQQDWTLQQLLDHCGVGEAFVRYFIMPMGAAIWSCPLQTMMVYPARTFVRFFDNHGLLGVNDQPQWYTVTGGSKTYVNKVIAALPDGCVRLGSGVQSVERTAKGVVVSDEQGFSDRFDQVVIASHGDEALAMLANPTEQEQALLSCFRFQENMAYLHCDESVMPKQRDCWASWVYHSDTPIDESPRLAVTYWMNLLQGIPEQTPLFVTLNPLSEPAADTVFDKHRFTHPIFDQPAIDAQEKLGEIQGADRIWYAGAWQRYGFHEDGILSAVHIARSMGVQIPWE